jgi:hypothetical protein
LKPLHSAKLAMLTRPAIIAAHDRPLLQKHGRWMANYCVTVLGILFPFGIDEDLMKDGRGHAIENPVCTEN